MRIKYANPYFKNEKMNSKLMDYLETRKPKQTPNPNLNQFEEELNPIPDRISRG